MAWRDNLRPASFRGVPFFIETSNFTSGRRVQFHEFPDRNTPFAEDLGKVGNTYRVEGYIVGGDEYWEQKTRLIEACNKEGPGELIHPYYGTLQVQCGPVSVEESTQEGRFAKISFQFFEAGDNSLPTNLDDKQALVETAVSEAETASLQSFEQSFSIKDQPGYVVEAARAQVQKALTAFNNATGGVVADSEKIAELAFSTKNLGAEVDGLLQSPGLLGQRLLDSLNLLGEAVESPEESSSAYSTLFDFGSDDEAVQETTPQRTQQIKNNNAINNFIIQSAVVKAIDKAVQVEYESVQDAESKRNELLDVLDSQILTTEDDEVFSALKTLLARTAAVLPDEDSDLPTLQNFTPIDVTPSLVLAHDLFENPDAELDLVSRNNIRHPGFIEAGTELEVLDVRTDD